MVDAPLTDEARREPRYEKKPQTWNLQAEFKVHDLLRATVRSGRLLSSAPSDDMHDDAKAANATPKGEAPGRAPRLISRLYRGARPGARAGMLAALIRPLGPLGLAAVASGAFAGFVTRRRGAGADVGLEEAGRFTSSQVLELARFVEQVDPDVFQNMVSDIIASPAGFTAFGVAVAFLVQRLCNRSGRREVG